MAEAQAQAHEGVPVKRYISVFFRYKYFITITFVVGTVLGVVGAVLFVRDMSVYDGSKLVLVQSPQTQLRNLLAEDPRRVQEDPFLLDAALAQLLDESVMRVVAQRCKLDEQEKAFATEAERSAGGRFLAWIEARLSFLFAPGEAESTFLDLATRRLRKDLSVAMTGGRGARSASGSSFPMTVAYFNKDPEKVTEVINVFIDVSRERRKAEFESSEFSKKQEDLQRSRYLELEGEYTTTAKNLAKIYDELGLPFDSDVNADLTLLQQRQLQVDDRVSRLTSEITQGRARISQLEANLKALQESGGGMIPIASQVDSPEARTVASELEDIEALRQEARRRLWSAQTSESEKAQLTSSLQDLQARWEKALAGFKEMQKTRTIRSPEVIRIEQDIAVRNAEVATLEAELAAVKDAREKQRNGEGARRAKIAGLSTLRTEYHRLSTRYDAAKAQFDERKIYKEARGQVEHIKDLTSKVELSELPRALAKVGRRKVVLAAAFGSLAAAIGIAFMLGVALDSSLHSPTDAERTLGLPVLSAIPELRRGFRP